MSLLSQNVIIESSRKSPICSFKIVSQELLQARLSPSVAKPEVSSVSLLTGYVPQSFKVAVIKPLLEKSF